MGGFLQGLMNGYGGMRLHLESLEFKAPVLPPRTTRVKMTSLMYLGNRFDLEYDDNMVTLTMRSVDADTSLLLEYGSEMIELTAGNGVQEIGYLFEKSIKY